jgi:hypothetical protein
MINFSLGLYGFDEEIKAPYHCRYDLSKEDLNSLTPERLAYILEPMKREIEHLNHKDREKLGVNNDYRM